MGPRARQRGMVVTDLQSRDSENGCGQKRLKGTRARAREGRAHKKGQGRELLVRRPVLRWRDLGEEKEKESQKEKGV